MYFRIKKKKDFVIEQVELIDRQLQLWQFTNMKIKILTCIEWAMIEHTLLQLHVK